MSQKLTRWFGGKHKPARPGVYERDYGSAEVHRRYCLWTGKKWHQASYSVVWAAKEMLPSNWGALPWRGLRAKG